VPISRVSLFGLPVSNICVETEEEQRMRIHLPAFSTDNFVCRFFEEVMCISYSNLGLG
jgi:hypothetical protein